MDVSEASLFRELAQIDQKNNKEYIAQAQKAAERAAARERLSVDKNDDKTSPFEAIERDIIRIMLLYGDTEVEMEEPVACEDQRGRTEEVGSTYRITIAREIIDSFAVDGITLRNPLLQNIFEGIKMLVAAKEPIEPAHFLKNEDSALVTLVSDLIGDDYQLARWDKLGVAVRDFTCVADTFTKDIVLRYREAHVKNLENEINGIMVNNIIPDEKRAEAYEKQNRLIYLRKRLDEELGDRVV